MKRSMTDGHRMRSWTEHLEPARRLAGTLTVEQRAAVRELLEDFDWGMVNPSACWDEIVGDLPPAVEHAPTPRARCAATGEDMDAHHCADCEAAG
jgi:hypothetical protein